MARGPHSLESRYTNFRIPYASDVRFLTRFGMTWFAEVWNDAAPLRFNFCNFFNVVTFLHVVRKD
jgi:hypothetical protein